MKLDLNCFSGNWPFYKVRYNTVKKLTQLHSRCGIEGGLVSSLEALFYQDPYEAEAELAKELFGTNYAQAAVVNPTLPGWQENLKRCVEILGIKAVRLIPSYHGYTLADPVMEQVAAMLRQYQLPLVLTVRIEDERTTWMVKPRPIAIDEVKVFLQSFADIRTLITNIQIDELAELADLFEVRANLFADTSGLVRGLFPVDMAYPLTNGQLVFGSSAPKNELGAIVNTVDTSLLTEEQKIAVYSGEAFLR